MLSTRFSILLVLILTLPACAYVEFKRRYALVSRSNHPAQVAVIAALEDYWREHGLALREQYRQAFPRDVEVIAFEIVAAPKPGKSEAQDRWLVIRVYEGRDIELIHREWFVEGIHNAWREDRKPEDIVGKEATSLQWYIKRTAGVDIDLVLVESIR